MSLSEIKPGQLESANGCRRSPSRRRLRAVLVGCGGVAHAHVLAAEANRDQIELQAAMDLDAERVESFCAENQIPVAYTSYEQMLREVRPDLVHIATPPEHHVNLSIQAMEAGAWVWCEKPLCGSLNELDRLHEAELRTGKYAACVFQNRFGSGVKHLKNMIHSEILGAPYLAVCHTLWYRDAAYFSSPWQGRWSSALGGTTLLHGIHAIDKLLYLGGEWDTVKAEMATLSHDIEVEDVSLAIVRFESGLLASIVNSAISPRQETYLRLDFEHATAECRYLYDCSNKNWNFSAAPHLPAAKFNLLRNIPADNLNNHAAQLRALLDDLHANRSPITAGEEARRTIEFMHSLYKSATTGQSVKRGSITRSDPFYYSFIGRPERSASNA